MRLFDDEHYKFAEEFAELSRADFMKCPPVGPRCQMCGKLSEWEALTEGRCLWCGARFPDIFEVNTEPAPAGTHPARFVLGVDWATAPDDTCVVIVDARTKTIVGVWYPKRAGT